jgi:hypothetical protein
MDPHWFGSLDPDPQADRSWTWIRIETNADPQHCRPPHVLVRPQISSCYVNLTQIKKCLDFIYFLTIIY